MRTSASSRRFQFGALRAINEDRMSTQDKIRMHPHREMEIFSYISFGQLAHGDSMKNIETIRAGGVQMTCAGTGIKHSEFNSDKTKECHFLRIWVNGTTGQSRKMSAP
ncbi:hypothetical protein FRC08_015942 [Ceratobasidium sp. 394]|nr:hypothetical protein FRC08_015942 [Ceratobasidium sp. 394]